MNIAIRSVLASLVLFGLATLVTWRMSAPIFDEVLTSDDLSRIGVAPLHQAITLVRTKEDDILILLGANVTGVSGVRVEMLRDETPKDVIDVYLAKGPEELRQVARIGEIVTLPWSDLALPFEENYPHIAVGTNYRAHAEEVGHDGDPFLFPKLSSATPWNADVREGVRLDYEIEICAVPLTDYTTKVRAELGYLLCGDFTDRWLLVRNIDLNGKMGQTGFPIGKGGDSRLPIGAFFVIPQSEDFYEAIQISLYVNGKLRQRSSGAQMIWSPYEALDQALADCESAYDLGHETVPLSDCETIPARTILLTGTPEGVLFKLPTIWNPLAYLGVGDVVTSIGRYLGQMRNEISER
jgi:2-keto-4-pentenoate hydratase/2-oxohepta-3-ene-1,7-dioic acid hydratase in catechol pathway